MPRLSVTGSWFHGEFHNLTTTINRSWQSDGDPLQNPNYMPFTVYNPLNGEPITAYGLKRCRAQRADAQPRHVRSEPQADLQRVQPGVQGAAGRRRADLRRLRVRARAHVELHGAGQPEQPPLLRRVQPGRGHSCRSRSSSSWPARIRCRGASRSARRCRATCRATTRAAEHDLHPRHYRLPGELRRRRARPARIIGPTP